MKALCWYGKHDVRVETVADPEILNPQDAIVKITTSAICGSDLHLYDGYIPTLEKGDILGHEFMGEIVEVGKRVTKLQKGDRVVVPFTISCGQCFFCQKQLWSLCDNTNPNAAEAELVNGYSTSGLYGYSHLYGGYAGGQAQFARVPFADVGPIKVENGIEDEKVLFLSDIFPTGYMAAENCAIEPGDTVAVWGCGPVGQFSIRSAFLLGAERVIAIDKVPERLALAEAAGAITISSEGETFEELKEITGGIGPDSCIDAVGMEAHGVTFDARLDKAKQSLKLGTDRPHALRQALHACRKGGTVSVPGVYAGFLDKIPFGMVMAKALTIKTGQTHVQRYLQPLLDRIVKGDIDPSFVITHRLSLDQAPEGYKTFLEKQDGCIKIVLNPWETMETQVPELQEAEEGPVGNEQAETAVASPQFAQEPR
jgi:threonine dehydrogenase-like Zn-dependent dehydrogenase